MKPINIMFNSNSHIAKRHSPLSLCVFAHICLFFFLFSFTPSIMAAPRPTLSKDTLKTATLSIPFVRNQGQIDDPAIAYYADTFACRVSVTQDGRLVYSLSGSDHSQDTSKFTVQEQLVNAAATVTGKHKAATKISSYQGNNPQKWRSAIPSFNRVSMGQIHNGIRLELQARANNVEKFFYVAPGADPKQIRLAVDGVKSLQVNARGELELIIPSGKMRFSKPIAYQTVNGRQQNVAVSYKIQGNTYGFTLGSYDTTKELVIDPLIASIPIKKGHHNDVKSLAVDNQGNVYAAGYINTYCAIYKLDAKLENVLAMVHFGTGKAHDILNQDLIRDIAVDSKGYVFVTGRAQGEGYPVTEGCFDNSASHSPHEPGPDEGVLTKFSPDLDKMEASTYIGGDWVDEAYAIAIDSQDNIYVTGYTTSSTFADHAPFPTTPGAYDTNQGEDGKTKTFVVKLNNTLSKLLAGTFLGGNQVDFYVHDVGYSIAIDTQSNVWVAGQTYASDFPVTQGSVDTAFTGKNEAFVAKLDANLTELKASTFLGGTSEESATSLLVDAAGNIYVGGWTESSDFPVVKDSYDTTYSQEEEDGFVAWLSSDLKELKAATFLGGTYDGDGDGDDVIYSMALSADGSALVAVGYTESENFPTTPQCHDSVNHRGSGPITSREPEEIHRADGFITIFNTNLTQCLSTFFGGKGLDYIDAVLINGDDILVGGETWSYNFPLMPAGKEEGGARGFVSRFYLNIQTSGSIEPDPDKPDNTPIGSRGGGGGGCFIESTTY